jgi:glycosyltransferase involved in cell wall biosynthesis
MQNNNIIRLLSVPSDHAGVSHFRNVWPSQGINKYYGDKFFAEINHDAHNMDMEYLKKFDIIHFHRHFGPYEQMEKNFKELQDNGVTLIMDIDDYWAPPKEHPLYHATVKEQMTEKVTSTLKLVDYVTTTTDIFANYIKPFNKNVFVIPNAIETEHPMWKDEDVKQTDKVRVAWIGGSCYDELTEVLTNEGFKLFKNLNKSEKIACLNPHNGEMEFHNPLGYIKQKFNGELICVENDFINFKVTPNHNMFCVDADKEDSVYSLIPAEDIYNSNNEYRFKKNCNWNGTERKFMIIPEIFSNEYDLQNILDKEENLNEFVGVTGLIDNQYGGKNIATVSKSVKNNIYILNRNDYPNRYKIDKKVNMDKWLKFFGFWLADGWISDKYQVSICQYKDNNVLEEMFEILSEMGFNPKYVKNKNTLRVVDKQLWTYLKKFGKANEKYIPKELLQLPKRQLDILLNYYLIGDGSMANKRKRQYAYTCSENLANNIQEICLKLNLSCSIKNRGKRTPKNQTTRLKIISNFDQFVLTIGKHGNRKSAPKILKKEYFKEQYNNFVYCVEVPYNIICVRRNKKIFFCGNSHLPDLEILKPSMNILHNDINMKDKYQIVMCGYDVRGFFTILNPDGTQTSRKIEPHETIWNKFEEIFTDNHNVNLVSPEYKKWLLKYKNEPYADQYKGGFVRRWTLPLTQYGKHYNYCDVCLAPLAENVFNEVKSELKIIEAGMKNKVLIAQDYGIYKELIQNNENGILINKKNSIRGWYEAIKKVTLDKEFREKLAYNLHEFVKDRYSLKAVTNTRAEFYLNVFNKKNQKEHKIEQINS